MDNIILIRNAADFTVRIIILFTTVIALIYFATVYSKYSFTFSFLVLLMLVSIIVKGVCNMFVKKNENLER